LIAFIYLCPSQAFAWMRIDDGYCSSEYT